MKNPIATFYMNSGKTIVIELMPDKAPNTVNSFIWLAKQGCYNGHAIQRIVPGYVIDASYTAFGFEKAKYLIAAESRAFGAENDLRLDPGVIAMGGYGDHGMAGGEFFFPLVFNPKLDGYYPGFGVIRQGLEEVMRWENVPTKAIELPGNPMKVNEPLEPIVIEKVEIETYGREYPEPVRLQSDWLPMTW